MTSTTPNTPPPKRVGGRGCPACGSHNTERLARSAAGIGAQWCRDCRNRWQPCEPHCRGYRFDLSNKHTGPAIIGCPNCGVPDPIARTWPEAYRAAARELDGAKHSQVTEE